MQRTANRAPVGRAAPEERVCELVAERIRASGLWEAPGEQPDRRRTHLVSPEPFALGPDTVRFLRDIGPALLAFYSAANDLYLHAGHEWVGEYLDIGKPEDVVRHAAMRYQRRSLPAVIRPDVLLTPEGPVITELDSVPGGIGHLDCLSAAYEDLGFELIGSPRGVRDAFAAMLKEAASKVDPVCAIVVSDESADYAPEMAYLAGELRGVGVSAHQVGPRDIAFTEEGLYLGAGRERRRIDVVYRFFELFDLPNIPKSELISYAARKKLAAITPPYKHFLEEKLLLALLHSEMLREYWTAAMGERTYLLLTRAICPTFILDNRPVPPHARISGFEWRGRPIRDWREIKSGTQKERRLALKPSGFSELSWGSRGLRIGHDMSQEDWGEAVEHALAEFERSPWVLQPFREASRWGLKYYDEASAGLRDMDARVRLCPYYLVFDGKAELAGVLATACPKDKKAIHGMVDAVMAPCSAAVGSPQHPSTGE